MRSLAALAFVSCVVASGLASAKRVVLRPTVANQCRSTATWNQMATCLRRFGKITVLRATGDMKLVSVGGFDDDFGIDGRYLFARHANRWNYTSSLGAEWLVDKVSTEVFEGHKVYRLDVSRASREGFTFGESMTQWGWVTERMAMLCSPEGASCASIITSCDIVVRGKAHARFRGTIRYIKDGEMQVHGDRTLAIDHCSQPEVALLPIRFD